MLEDIAGREVSGYRAPSFSIGPANFWAFDCIAEAGYRYSSSIYPIRHDHYGAPDAPRFPYRCARACSRCRSRRCACCDSNWPAGGGGYFRLLPYRVSKWSIGRVNAVDGKPAMFYFHPWELDPTQPRVKGPGAKARFRHYLNLDRTEPRLRSLLADFRWDQSRSRLPEWRRMMESAASEVVRIGRAADRVSVRPFVGADAPAWDAFVERCPEATFFHRIGWREIIEGVFRHRTHYLVAERPGAIAGILPLAEVKSRLFGHALVSLPFGVYGGPAATDAEAGRALVEAASASRRLARRRASRIPQSRGEMPGLAAAGSVRALSQDAACPTSRPTCSRCRASSAR